MTPLQPYRTGQYYEYEKNLYTQGEWDHAVVTNIIVPLSAGSTPLPTTLPQPG